MTKKHFIAIAAIIKRQMGMAPVEAHYTVREITEALAAEFKKANPAFDKQRFMTAAGF